MPRRRTGQAFDRQQLRQLQQQQAASTVQAASTAASIEENVGDGMGLTQAQIDNIIVRLDAAAIP